jgi:phosphoribosylaminoimidazolecarboxamide formyltransferase/IMP cyclohydrolase
MAAVTSLDFASAGRQGLCATAAYDAMIASWFAFADQGEMFPTRCR